MKTTYSVLLSVSFMLLAALNIHAETLQKELYAGADICMECHEERYESYAASVHGVTGDPRTPAARRGCETCHGPGAAHVDEGGGKGVGGILPLLPRTSADVHAINDVCLSCHTKGKVVLWNGSAHETRNLACTDCHSIHGSNPVLLKAETETETCVSCHKRVRAELLKSSHHPVREGKIRCTDCHNPHGTIADRLIEANYINEKCYECHAEKRGPFIWEHPPVTEDCMTCHTPHGTSHDKLLAARRPYLCNRCHSNERHPGTLAAISPVQAEAGQPVYSALNTRVFYRSCQNCHSQIHGSNHPSGKNLTR